MSDIGGASGLGGTVDCYEGPFLGPLKPLLVPLRFLTVAQPVNVGSSSAVLTQSLYKGGFPRRRNLPFLSRLRLKTILSLTPKPLDVLEEDVSQWAKSNDISLVHVKCEKPKDDGGGLSKEAAAKALMHLLDSRQLPLYVHCLDGQSVSTLMVAVLRRVQAWSIRATVEEIKQSLGHDEEVIGYQTLFVEKYGKPDGVRLPPRRFIPDWAWTDPSPLKRLKDPYDVIVPKEKLPPADRSAVANNGANGQHKRWESNDGYFSSITSSNASPTLAGSTLGVGTLPVQHPLLRIKFDADPDLPPPPASAPSGILTPLHSRDNFSLFSPTSSRPSSRAGRHTSHGHALHPNHHHIHQHPAEAVRSMSRSESAQGSPRRKNAKLEQSPSLESSSRANFTDEPFSPPSHHTDFVSSRLGQSSSSSAVDEQEGAALQAPQSIGSPNAKHCIATLRHQDSIGSSTPTRSSLLLNQSTPRASSSLVDPVRRPASTRGAVYGLGLNSAEGQDQQRTVEGDTNDSVLRSASPTANLLSNKLQAVQSVRPGPLERSVSEMVKSPSSQARTQMLDNHDEEEYYSDTQEDSTRPPSGNVRGLGKEKRNDTGSGDEEEGQAGQPDGDEAEWQSEEVVVEEEEEEMEEEEEEEEEDESDDEDDDGLALEALDLEGY